MDLRHKKLAKNPRNALHKVDGRGPRKFDLLPSELNLAWVVKNPAQMEYKLEKLLSVLRPEYDFIFIDCAPTDSVLTTMALTASDFLLVPVRPDRFSVLGFENLLTTVRQFKKNCNDPHDVKDLGIVFTQVLGSSTVEAECMVDIRARAATEDGYVFAATLNHSTSFIRAVKEQTPIFRTWHAHDGCKKAAAAVAKEMQDRIASFG